jgi:hypothetical protein
MDSHAQACLTEVLDAENLDALVADDCRQGSRLRRSHARTSLLTSIFPRDRVHKAASLEPRRSVYRPAWIARLGSACLACAMPREERTSVDGR